MSEAQRLARRDISPKNGAAIVAIVSQPHDLDWYDAVPGERLSTRVRSSQVGGRYAILESIAAPGTAVPLHYHREDEVFYVLEGVATFSCGGTIFDAKPGTTVALPAGAHHAWKNRTARPLRMLAFFSPGGVESLFERLAGRSPEEIAAIAEPYGSYIVGPPIEG